MTNATVIDTLHTLVVLLAVLTAVMGLTTYLMFRRMRSMHERLQRAQRAAEEAVRNAAMASPGGIDPEAVLEVLSVGMPPTLDNVYKAMRRRELERAGVTAGD